MPKTLSNKTKQQKKKKGNGTTRRAPQPRRAPTAPPKPRARPAPRPSAPSLRLSDCAYKYALAIADPWNPLSSGACVPTGMSGMRSSKVRLFSRFTMSVGNTTGTDLYGIIDIMGSACNDAPAAVYSANIGHFGGTLPANSGASVSLSSAIQIPATALLLGNGGSSTAAVVKGAYFNAPYTASQFLSADGETPPEVSARTVSTSVRIYCDTPMNFKGGSLFLYVDDDHGNLNMVAPGDLANEETCRIIEQTEMGTSRSRGLEQASTSGTNDHEFAYPNGVPGTSFQRQSIYGFSNMSPLNDTTKAPGAAGSATGGWAMDMGAIVGASPMRIVLLPSAVGVSTYRVEVVSHIEYIGSATVSGHTPSHVDPHGFALVNAASRGLASAQLANPSTPPISLMQRLITGAESAMTHFSNNKESYAKAGRAVLSVAGASRGNLAIGF